MIYDCIIIGSGPAGMAASLYLKRAKLNILIIEKNAPGGKLLSNTMCIENYLGFRNTTGIDLVKVMYQQMRDLAIPYVFKEVVKIEKSDLFIITTRNNAVYLAKRVVFAGGSIPKQLGLDCEELYLNKGISHCALCDGDFYSGKDVAVIGNSLAALQEAFFLSKICKSVKIITNQQKLKTDNTFLDKLLATGNIEIIMNAETISLFGKDSLEGIIYRSSENELITLLVNGLFIYAGWKPSTDILRHFGVVNEKGYIIANEELETKIGGLYGAGDCLEKHLRQIITAVSDGAVVASSIIRKM